METCEVCGAKVNELRRGRCWGCYGRWAVSRPVGLGAACCMCGEKRRDHLRSVELLGGFVPACHDCSARALVLEPLPQSLAEIRAALRRERRVATRRIGGGDARAVARDRRELDRRAGRDVQEIDDAMILEIAEDLIALGAPLHDPLDVAELTAIRDRPLRPAPPR